MPSTLPPFLAFLDDGNKRQEKGDDKQKTLV